jgi:hypothetical protein
MQLADDTHAAVVSSLATRNTDSGQKHNRMPLVE